jgi:hypothetical protein
LAEDLGVSERRRRTFLEALAEGARVKAACRAAGLTKRRAYLARRREAAFARAWDAAVAHGQEAKRRRFLASLAGGSGVRAACRRAGLSHSGVYRARAADPGFTAAWRAAAAAARDAAAWRARQQTDARLRALAEHGESAAERVGRFPNSVLIQLLKLRRPERYG